MGSASKTAQFVSQTGGGAPWTSTSNLNTYEGTVGASGAITDLFGAPDSVSQTATLSVAAATIPTSITGFSATMRVNSKNTRGSFALLNISGDNVSHQTYAEEAVYTEDVVSVGVTAAQARAGFSLEVQASDGESAGEAPALDGIRFDYAWTDVATGLPGKISVGVGLAM